MDEVTPEGIASIREWLDLKVVTGRYSSGLARELAVCVEYRRKNIFQILDEIGALEKAPNSRSTNTKPATPLTGRLLAGLWHKHYSQAAFIPINILNHWEANDFQERIIAAVKDHDLSGKSAGLIAHEFVIGGYQERSQSGKMTGEWIVFARQDEVNYYLTLGTHLEGDEAIQKRVLACQDEFPGLRIGPQAAG